MKVKDSPPKEGGCESTRSNWKREAHTHQGSCPTWISGMPLRPRFSNVPLRRQGLRCASETTCVEPRNGDAQVHRFLGKNLTPQKHIREPDASEAHRATKNDSDVPLRRLDVQCASETTRSFLFFFVLRGARKHRTKSSFAGAGSPEREPSASNSV